MKEFVKEKRLIKAKELSIKIPYSESWIRLKVKQNVIPYYRVGRNLLFDYEEVMSMIRTTRVPSASEAASEIQTKRRITNEYKM